MQRGEVWWANLPPPWNRRPVLLLSRTAAYSILTYVVVAPLTSTIREARSYVPLDPRADGVLQPSVINVDAIQGVNVEWLDSKITQLRPEKMDAVEKAIHFALAMKS